MKDELFHYKRRLVDQYIPPESEQSYKDHLSVAIGAEKLKCIWALVEIFRMENRFDEMIALFLAQYADVEIRQQVVGMMMKEGAVRETANDFENAVKIYEAVPYFDDAMMRYFKFNNLGYSLNFLKRFPDAERVIRKAIEICPGQYNAWKNLGVSLEHQGQIEEAAEAYLTAVRQSKGQEPRSRQHFERLIDRNPSLLNINAVRRYYFAKDEVLRNE